MRRKCRIWVSFAALPSINHISEAEKLIIVTRVTLVQVRRGDSFGRVHCSGEIRRYLVVRRLCHVSPVKKAYSISCH